MSRLRISVPVMLGLIAASLLPGQSGFLLLNRDDEQTSCVVADANASDCANPSSDIRLGHTILLRVLNRRFLTEYVLELGPSSHADPIPARIYGGEVRAVVIPHRNTFARDLAPARLPRKSTFEFVQQLLDVTSGSEPVAELAKQGQALQANSQRMVRRISAFNQKYALVVGQNDTQRAALDVLPRDCSPGKLERDGFWLARCLNVDFQRDSTGPWADGATPFLDESGFRQLLVRAEALFEETKNFASDLASEDLQDESLAIESAAAALEADRVTFASNLNAATGAVLVLQQLEGAHRPPLALQIRAQLRQRFASALPLTGGSRPALDEAEANQLIDHYLQLLSQTDSIPQKWRRELESAIVNLQPIVTMPPAFPEDLSEIRGKMDVELPQLVKSINDWEKRLAMRLNWIQDRSVIGTSDAVFDLGIAARETVVSYKILRTVEFEPWVFRQPGAIDPAAPLAPRHPVEVSTGAFAISRDAPPERARPRTLWEMLRITHPPDF